MDNGRYNTRLFWLLRPLSNMYSLNVSTTQAWVDAVMADFDAFLIDHAAAEKKASGMAISMLSHYPDKAELVLAMSDLAIEEMTHFREVVKILHQRGLQLGPDQKDPYVNALRGEMRKPRDEYFLDRLLVGSIVEARGHERFGLVAAALPTGALKKFYLAITESEGRHDNLFCQLAQTYFPTAAVQSRLEYLLAREADIVAELPIRAALH